MTRGSSQRRLVLREARLADNVVDVLVDGATIAAIGAAGGSMPADEVFDCHGGALVPGLHDHHLHLLAMAAADRSLQLHGRDLDTALRDAHRALPANAWIRAVGYDEARHGPLDRHRLDALAPGRPVRVQHRSGALWVLSSPALTATGADEVDGRLFGRDGWLRSRLPAAPAPDLTAVGKRLASYGITGVTDATPSVDPDDFAVLARAQGGGQLRCAVMVTGGPALATTAPPPPLRRGPVKVVIADHDLPPLDRLAAWFREAHHAGRAVAVHCVTRAALALALAAWDDVGSVAGDRVEHGAIIDPATASRHAEHHLTVVTQPGFLATKGDGYLRDVDPADVPHLYPSGSLLRAGIGVGGSTDAPFGPDDPWLAIRTAIDRRTATGEPIGAAEAVAPATALGLFLTPLDEPGGAPRTVHIGAPADLVVLDAPLAEALADPSAERVLFTVAGGTPTFER